MAFKIAVVGYGSAGQQHVEVLRDLGGAELYCVVESNLEVDTGELPRQYSLQDVLADQKVDAVALCLPPGGRSNLAHEALAAGKSVLLEKPPCRTEAELDLLLNATQVANRSIGIMFQHRYRLFDEILNFTWDESTTAILEVSRPRNPERYFTSWRQDPMLSIGGITAHLGVHYMDLACLLLGLPKEFQQIGRRDFMPGIDMRVAGAVQFSGGSTMAFVVTGEVESRSERLNILGRDIRLTIQDGSITIEKGGELRHYSSEPTSLMRKRLYEDFVSAAINQEQPKRCSLESGRGVTRLLENIAAKAVKND
ncbi:Gfo/Idh/MocA family oxidoreductase [Paenibacillus sp. MZ04-78.2]|uniref:Gfo/Idh/MocA family protein n=1 Tax=Paenibacillus sp. MZ04-78.2 TaxID=2962034 RepID=UPI0020B8B4A1|nr:Gfo/Idh/MocA family oxidoreductase [Paenibacillus sp. MZ04-78.2]MCP3776517.1 Gfo/Idh/MocA family oxidoreductase [Paenibacillus sp. MZ04-78.2]